MEKRKNEFVSKYKSKLKYLYGDINKVLGECVPQKRSFVSVRNESQRAISFDQALINEDLNKETKKFNKYISAIIRRNA